MHGKEAFYQKTYTKTLVHIGKCDVCEDPAVWLVNFGDNEPMLFCRDCGEDAERVTFIRDVRLIDNTDILCEHCTCRGITEEEQFRVKEAIEQFIQMEWPVGTAKYIPTPATRHLILDETSHYSCDDHVSIVASYFFE